MDTNSLSHTTYNSEYQESDSHNHVKSNSSKDVFMVSHADSKVSFSMTHRNRKINVTLEFPEQSDQKAEQELITGLKEIYLKKMENGAMQKKDFALSSPTTQEKPGKRSGKEGDVHA